MTDPKEKATSPIEQQVPATPAETPENQAAAAQAQQQQQSGIEKQ